jgi:hypothetical protein
LTWGSGGPQTAPAPPFTFLGEDLGGANPKIEVADANGVKWKVKFGEEVHAEVFATRLVWALGYYVEETYFVPSGRIDGVKGLTRAAQYVTSAGAFTNARFEIRGKGVKRLKGIQSWSWVNNPFAGTRELNGLKILVMLLSNWDVKDATTGGNESNTVILLTPRANGGSDARYVVSDWGASMGKWGGIGFRNKWNCQAFTAQSRDLARLVHGQIAWGYSALRKEGIVEGVGRDDLVWLMQHLGRVTDDQVRAGLVAAGATPEETACYTAALRSRIALLGRLVKESTAPNVPAR